MIGIYRRLLLLIETTMAQYPNGEPFFTAIDDAVRHTTYAELLMRWSGEPKCNVAVSGQFGRFFATYFQHRIHSLIIFPGELRTKKIRPMPTHYRDRLSGRRFVFLDDSYYSGATRLNIKNEIEAFGGELGDTFVIYDGSPEVHPHVTSIYRYYC